MHSKPKNLTANKSAWKRRGDERPHNCIDFVAGTKREDEEGGLRARHVKWEGTPECGGGEMSFAQSTCTTAFVNDT